MKSLPTTSIRVRLLFVYVGILIIGFAGITVIAGGQIASAAQADYTQRLQNEVRLVAQGIDDLIDRYASGEVNSDELDAAITTYASQVDGSLKLYPAQGDGGPPLARDTFRGMLELETAQQGQIVVVRRQNDAGEDTFYTAAPISHNRRLQMLVQLSVPAQNLQTLLLQRWAELGLVFAVMTALALFAALWLSRSIIQPLYRLRDSALHLSKGDFSHRVEPVGQDEIGEVAHAFNEMAQQVQSMLEEQRAFASNTSHELRTPLTTIRLRTEALRYDVSLDTATTRRYIEEIDGEAARLGNLVQDLTLLSRFDAGRAELGRDEVDMQRFAASIQHQMSAQAREKDIQIILDLPPDILVIHASLNHLTVVFRNLLDNAIKYTPQGGKITWQISKAAEGVNHAITDTGRGVAVDDLPYLFERFYRVDKARSRDIPGTGLGLALVKSIVKAYGGDIRVESEGIDRGTTVRLYWPYLPADNV